MDLFPGIESEKDDEIPYWEYEPIYEEFHKFSRNKPANLPSKSDTRFAEPIPKAAKISARISKPNIPHEERFHEERISASQKKVHPSERGESNPHYQLYRNIKHPTSIENDDEDHLPNMNHNDYYYEEEYPTSSHDRNNDNRQGMKKHKQAKFYDNYMQDSSQQNYVKEPLSYFEKKEKMRPSKRLIHEIKVVEIANDMKDDGKSLHIPKRGVENGAEGNLEDESQDLSLKVRDLKENFSPQLSVSETEDINHNSPTKRMLRLPNDDKSIHTRLIEVFQEPLYKSENDGTGRKRGLNNPAGKSKNLENLLNLLTGGIDDDKDNLKPANEETEINIVVRRTVRQKDFKAGKNSSAYYGAVTHWKEDMDKQEKISQLSGNGSFDVTNNFVPADSSGESEELRKKRNKSSRQLHSLFLVGPKGWKTFSKVSKRSHTETPRSLKLTTRAGNKSFDYEEEISEEIKDFIHRHSQNISNNERVNIDSNVSKVIEVNEETLPETNLSSINKKENVIRLEEKTFHSLGRPESYKSLLSDEIETPEKNIASSTVLKGPPDKSKNAATDNLISNLINEQIISSELQLLLNALNLHMGKSTAPSNILTTENKMITHGGTTISTTGKPLQMNLTSDSLSTEATVTPKSGLGWDLSKIGNFLLQSIGLGTQTTQSPVYHEENKSMPIIISKSNISSFKVSQKVKTKNRTSLQKSRKPKPKLKITKRPPKLSKVGTKAKKKKLLPAKKQPNTTSSGFQKNKKGRITSKIPKLSEGCKYCSKEIKIIDTSVEIYRSSTAVPVTYKVFIENNLELVTSPAKSVPFETENGEMKTYLITSSPKLFKLTTEDFSKKADIVFNKIVERNPQSLSINHLDFPSKTDVTSENASKPFQNEFSTDGDKSTILEDSSSEPYQPTNESVEFNKRNLDSAKTKAKNLASIRYLRQPKNFSESGKLTVNEKISRNVILTDLLSLLSKKDDLKKDRDDRSTNQNNHPKFFDLSGKHPYLAGFILGVGLVIIFLIFSIMLYWMGFKKGQYDYYSKETEKVPETTVHLLPKDERRATIADNGNVFYAINGDESTDMKTLKHLVAKASIMNTSDPVKEDVKLLKKRVINNENEIIPIQRSSSKIFRRQSSRSRQRSQLESEKFEPKLNSVSNDGSDEESWNGVFDTNRKPSLEILDDESSVQKLKNPSIKKMAAVATENSCAAVNTEATATHCLFEQLKLRYVGGTF
ncbi:hypothetical protein HNY73_013036 [Argiope bruennichi]|uniref:Uncharacterized protein n=1 Tax=Argiope bruennichi TaxID=94029 RepID=A0A8T0EYX1_ARGBR|nr:hypothetical protein HNY73_013036 [Argiope bruennichi]